MNADEIKKFHALASGWDIRTGSLAKGDAPPELLALYQKWLNDIFEIKYPGWYSKHVSLYFIYKGVRYVLEPDEFNEHVKKDGREGNRGPHFFYVDDARAEALFWKIVQPDLEKLGIGPDDIYQYGSLD